MAAKPSSSAVLQQTARLQHAQQLQCLRGCRFPGNHFAFSMYPVKWQIPQCVKQDLAKLMGTQLMPQNHE